MTTVSLPTAIALTKWSERTFYRKFSDGSLSRETQNGKVVISFEELGPHLCMQFEPEDVLVIERADQGDAEAQNDLALIFLSNNHAAGAIHWLTLSANQNNADAMAILGQCYLDGSGVEKDKNLAVMWLAKAAAYGHLIAQRQMGGVVGTRS